MYKDLVAVLGKHIDSPAFKAVMEKHFPNYNGFNADRNYRDKKTKVDLRIDWLGSYDDEAKTPEDPNEFNYFTAFFFGKDESEIPFGITSKDNEEIVIKKAGLPTFHNKVTDVSVIMNCNDLHYHMQNFKMVVAFDPASGKQFGISIQLRLKGMKF